MTSLWLDAHPPIETDAFTPDASYDTVVVGAGITGITTALLLARAGERVIVLEGREVGAVTTGNTTAKITLLQGRQVSRILQHHAPDVAKAYVEANREGQSWLLRYCGEHGVPFQSRDSYSYTVTDDGRKALEEELDACRSVGIDARLTEDTELPFATTGAMILPDQAQFNPMDYLAAAVRELRSRGGVVVDKTRVRRLGTGAPVTVSTDLGTVTARQVVLATGTPILNRGGHFALLKPSRSYALAFRTSGAVPQGMYISLDSPGRSLRTHPAGVVNNDGGTSGGDYLIVGGNGHPVGRERHARAQVEDLQRWAESHFPGSELTHSWSAQDYEPTGALPYVGTVPWSGNVHSATGYNKWGMTNGVAAALALSADILGGSNSWAKVLYRTRISAHDAVSTVQANSEVAVEMVSGWLSGLSRSHSVNPPEGQGTVVRENNRPVGLCTVQGTRHKVSAVCPHLGGVLAWNDAEQSWDCPLHGSRFSAEGTVLEGPATRDLARPEE